MGLERATVPERGLFKRDQVWLTCINPADIFNAILSAWLLVLLSTISDA